MNRVPDRKKLRQEYLHKRGKAYAGVTFGSVAMIAAIIIGGGAGSVVGCILWLVATGRGFFINPFGGGYNWSLIGSFCTGLLISLVCCAVVTFSWFGIRKARVAAQIEHVPPVTPSTLPAEEILVRSAEPPAATSETLLRAASATTQTEPEHLLRAGTAHKNGQGSL